MLENNHCRPSVFVICLMWYSDAQLVWKVRPYTQCGTKVVGHNGSLGAQPPAGVPRWGFRGLSRSPLKLTTFYWYNIEFLRLCPTWYNLTNSKQHIVPKLTLSEQDAICICCATLQYSLTVIKHVISSVFLIFWPSVDIVYISNMLVTHDLHHHWSIHPIIYYLHAAQRQLTCEYYKKFNVPDEHWMLSAHLIPD